MVTYNLRMGYFVNYGNVGLTYNLIDKIQIQ